MHATTRCSFATQVRHVISFGRSIMIAVADAPGEKRTADTDISTELPQTAQGGVGFNDAGSRDCRKCNFLKSPT